MAIGPVWDALIHATSCHLPPLPACSPSAAARLLSLLMSIFRAGRFLPSKMGKCVVEREGVCTRVCFFFGFFDILPRTVGQLVHMFPTPLLLVPANITAHIVRSGTHARFPYAFGGSLFSAPGEIVD